MSILIKDMEMPANCFLCKLSYMSGERLFCSAMKNEEVLRSKIDSNCPLIELPPHGRLIVEDDAIETAWMILAGIGYRREENPQLEQTVREVYATAPTIEVE